jgi:hypothetical protein
LPPFADFWAAFEEVFGRLDGTRPAFQLRRAQSGDLDPNWTTPKAIGSWRYRFPLELLR